MWSTGRGHLSTCKLLIKSGAQINLQDTVSIYCHDVNHLKKCKSLTDLYYRPAIEQLNLVSSRFLSVGGWLFGESPEPWSKLLIENP